MTLPDLDGNPATTNDIATYGYQYDARGNMVQLTRTLPLGFGTDGKFGTADDPAVGQASSLPFTEHVWTNQ